jgi:hypothetical protein
VRGERSIKLESVPTVTRICRDRAEVGIADFDTNQHRRVAKLSATMRASRRTSASICRDGRDRRHVTSRDIEIIPTQRQGVSSRHAARAAASHAAEPHEEIGRRQTHVDLRRQSAQPPLVTSPTLYILPIGRGSRSSRTRSGPIMNPSGFDSRPSSRETGSARPDGAGQPGFHLTSLRGVPAATPAPVGGQDESLSSDIASSTGDARNRISRTRARSRVTLETSGEEDAIGTAFPGDGHRNRAVHPYRRARRRRDTTARCESADDHRLPRCAG